MERITRRAMLAGAATAGAAAAVVVLPRQAFPDQAPALAVYDSRLPEAPAFAAAARRQGIALHDIAREEQSLWRASRALHAQGAVIGLTRWSDWIALRDLFAERGLRARHEAAVGATGKASAFRWRMA